MQKKEAGLILRFKMRIAFIAHYPRFYGANRSLLNLIEGLKAYGVSSFVIVPELGEFTERLESTQVPYAVLPIENWMQVVPGESTFDKRIRQYLYIKRQVLKRAFINLTLLPHIIKQFNKWQVDLIYSNSSVISIGWIIAKILKKPHVFHIREFSLEHYKMEFDWGRRISIKIIHSSYAKIVVSNSIKRYYFVENDSSVHVVYNGVLPAKKFDDLYHNKKACNQESQNFKFAIVGMIHPNKGQDVAIRALALVLQKYKNSTLQIVGDGEKGYLEKIIQELQIEDSVEFPGYVKDPFEIYTSIDCLLVCSKFEAMGRVTVEAMAACCPVVGFDRAGTAELIRHEVTGLLYEGDHKELSACMLRLIENPELRERLVENAWKEAKSKYTVEAYAENVHKIIVGLIR